MKSIVESVGVPTPPAVINGKLFLESLGANKHKLCILDQVRNDHNLYPYLRSYISRLNHRVGTVEVCYLDAEEYSKAKRENGRELLDYVDTEKMVMDLLRDAVERDSSDIYIHVYEDSHASIHFKQQGDKRFYAKKSTEDADKLCNALFSSIGEHQSETTFSGYKRMRARISNRSILPADVASIRLESGPIAGGYHMVLRLLYKRTQEASGTMAQRLNSLGYHESHIKDIIKAQSRPSGIVVISGPTGSGKSTTLKAIIEAKHEEAPNLHILTVEDPPEYPIKGAVQIRAGGLDTEKSGDDANYSDAIRHSLRCAPDVIMIGEIRDGQSGMSAISAATTGHLVFTTVHANRLYSVLSRLRDLISPATEGVDPNAYLCDGSIISGFCYQTLIKTLCPACKTGFDQARGNLPPDLLERMRHVGLLRDCARLRFRADHPSKHCKACNGTGYAGRQVLAETCVADQALLDAFGEGGTVGLMQVWRMRKPMDLEAHAIHKIRLGLVDPRDVEARIGPLGGV